MSYELRRTDGRRTLLRQQLLDFATRICVDLKSPSSPPPSSSSSSSSSYFRERLGVCISVWITRFAMQPRSWTLRWSRATRLSLTRLSPSWPTPAPAPACSAPPSRASDAAEARQREGVRGVLDPVRSGSPVTSHSSRALGRSIKHVIFFRLHTK